MVAIASPSTLTLWKLPFSRWMIAVLNSGEPWMMEGLGDIAEDELKVWA